MRVRKLSCALAAIGLEPQKAVRRFSLVMQKVESNIDVDVT